MKNCVVFVLIIFSLISCDGSRKEYYKEFDLFSFEGIDNKENTYPFVEVAYNERNEIKTITYFLNSSLKEICHVFKKDLVYRGDSSFVEDDGVHRNYYTVYMKNYIVDYLYMYDPSSNPIKTLNTITIKEKN